MSLSFILKTGERAIDAVSESFSPTKKASSSEIRRNGLMCLCIGICCLAISCGLILMIPKSSLTGFTILPAYVFMVTGAYRMVLGRAPEPAHPGELSVKRVIFAVTTIVFISGGLIGLMLVGKYIHTYIQSL